VSASVSAGTYYIRVGGYNGATGTFGLDVSGPSAPASPPSAPSGLGATAAGSAQVNLAWTDTANDETGYEVERSTNGSTFSLAATLGANSESFNDTGRSASTTYWYRVRATNGGGPSGYSNTANASTDPSSVQLYLVTSESSNHGVVNGSYSATNGDDGSYQTITERTAKKRNSLEHEWSIANVPSSGTRTLRVQAHRTVSSDNDTFIMQVRVGGSWTTAITVIKITDDNVYQEWVLPSGASGTVSIRVRDSNNSRRASGEDTLTVDHIVIEAQ
jgi:hypothetical protein